MQANYSLWNVLGQYFENSALLPLFVLALIWIINKWNKDRKVAFIAIACGSVLVFNEVAYRFFSAIGEGSTYYRFLWIIPLVLVVAAFLVNYVTVANAGKQYFVLALTLLAIWMFSGQTGAEWLTLPENIYQIEPDVIQVSDLLMKLTDNQATYLIDDRSISNTIRQYNAKVMCTDMELADMDMILQGNDTNALGKDIQNAINNNRSRYIAINKEDTIIYKVMENAGIKLAGETDHYRLYYVHYKQLIPDVEEMQKLSIGESGQTNIEYVPIQGFTKRLEYVYITDFGTTENEEVYKNVLKQIEEMQPDGIIINAELSKNSNWHRKYETLLEEQGIPYYCNDTEFQVISEDEIEICFIDNRRTISKTALNSLENLMKEGKPILLVLSENISESDSSDLVKLISKPNSTVIQVLSAKQDTFQKNLIGEQILQFATPTDSNQLLNLIRIEGLEPDEIIVY